MTIQILVDLLGTWSKNRSSKPVLWNVLVLQNFYSFMELSAVNLRLVLVPIYTFSCRSSTF